MSRLSSLVAGWAAASVVAGVALAGPVPRIAHTLIGTVVSVDAIARSLTVRARRLEARMGAITTIYDVDNSKVLREVNAGDQIMGKVFDGESALHHVQIIAVAARPVTEDS